MTNSDKLHLLYCSDLATYQRIKENYPHLVADPEHAYPNEKKMFNAIVTNCINNPQLKRKLLM